MTRHKSIIPLAYCCRLLFVGCLFLLASCASVQLIAPYDAKIDEDVTSLQKNTLDFLAKIRSEGGTSKSDYSSGTHVKFYNDTHVALSTLETRVNAISDNQITFQQVQILEQQFDLLKNKDRADGLSVKTVNETEKALNETFQAILTLEVAKKGLSSSSSSSTPSDKSN